MWPFRHRHRPQDAPAVIEAQEKRDNAFVALDQAVQEVDRVYETIVEDYEEAEEQRLKGKRKRK